MRTDIKPLYRRVNTKVIGVHNIHNVGSDAKFDRNTKSGLNKSMKNKVNRGLDYTPLYMYLISKVGEDWDIVFSYAIKRLDKEDPIYYLVAKTEFDKRDIVRCGESSYYSGLYVDENNILQKVNTNLKNEDLHPGCWCCTHTFNGKVYINKYK